MGLTNREDIKYVRIKDGKFYLSSDKERSFSELENVTITSFYFKDEEYQGQKIKKMVMKMMEGGDAYVLAIPFESGYTSSLIGFLKNADLTKPVSLSPSAKEKENGKSERRIFVKQGGLNLKSFYTKATPNGLPSMKKVVKKNGKVEWDKEDYLDFLENVIKSEFIPIVSGRRAVNISEEISHAEETEAGEDLPF